MNQTGQFFTSTAVMVAIKIGKLEVICILST